MIVSQQVPVPTAKDGEAARQLPWRLLIVVIVTAFAIIGTDISDGGAYLADVDDRLRALQIRQLLSSGVWFDLTLPMIRMPEAYVSFWSRLVDLPYVFITLLLSHFMDPAKALRWSFLIWPPIMLLAFCVLVMRIVRGLSDGRSSTDGFVLIAMTLSMMLAISEFSPGRIDHHNMQIVLLLTMCAGVVAWNGRGALAIGISAALQLAIGLECMPIVAAVFAGIVLASVSGATGATRMLRIAMLTVALATPVATLILIGPAGFTSTQCDALSAPYIYLATLLPLAAIAASFSPVSSPAGRLVFHVVAAAVFVAGFLWLFPGCAHGPYAIIDPVTRHFWFERVRQESNALDYFRSDHLGPVMALGGQALVLLLAWPGVLARLRCGRPQRAVVFGASLSSLFMALALIRSAEFQAVLVTLFLPAAFQQLVTGLEPSRRRGKLLQWIALSVALVTAVGSVAWALTPVMAEHADVIDSLNGNNCAVDAVSKLEWPPSTIIMATPTLAFSIAERAPAGLAVAASATHRSSPGLRRTYLAFTTSDRSVRREAMAPFDYVAVCRDAVPADGGDAPLYRVLASNGSWPGLLPFGDDDPQRRLRLFRIDHQRLE